MIFLKPFSGGGNNDDIPFRIRLNDSFYLFILFGVRHGRTTELYYLAHRSSVLQDSRHKQFFARLRFCDGMCFHNRNGFGNESFTAVDDL